MKKLLNLWQTIRLKTLKLLIVMIPIVLLTACATTNTKSPQTEFATGKQDFVSHHYQEAFQQLEPLAKNGNANAQYAIGYMYFYGKGVQEDPEMGAVWIKKSARQGQPLARKAWAMLNKLKQQEEASKIFMPKDQPTMNLRKVAGKHTPLLSKSLSS